MRLNRIGTPVARKAYPGGNALAEAEYSVLSFQKALKEGRHIILMSCFIFGISVHRFINAVFNYNGNWRKRFQALILNPRRAAPLEKGARPIPDLSAHRGLFAHCRFDSRKFLRARWEIMLLLPLCPGRRSPCPDADLPTSLRNVSKGIVYFQRASLKKARKPRQTPRPNYS